MNELAYPHKHLIVLVGPTAVGKTDLSIRLAQHFNTEIISADSRQIYRELCIGTARPSLVEMQRVRHHFIGTRSVQDYYNASMFETDVLDTLNRLFRHYDRVLMTGGSTLYVDTVFHGIDDLPSVDMDIRNQLTRQYKALGIGYLREQLLNLDPEHYARVDRNNPNRMMKAIEVSLMTGKPYSSFLTASRKQRDFNFIRIGLKREREELFERINTRVDGMIRNGLVDEVRNLSYARHTNALQTVGYRELFEYLDGTCSLEEAVEKIKTNTRRYAKRQITWFSRYHDMKWFHPNDEKVIFEYIHSILDS